MLLFVGVEGGEEGGVDGVHLHHLPLLPAPRVLELTRLKEAGEGGVREAEGGGGGHHRHRWVRRVSHSLQMFLYLGSRYKHSWRQNRPVAFPFYTYPCHSLSTPFTF